MNQQGHSAQELLSDSHTPDRMLYLGH